MPQGDQPLTREAIAAKALEIASTEGLEGLSARRLAGAFGKTAMALYRHFGSMEEIQHAMVALAYREVDAEPVPGELWEDTLRRTMGSIRRVELKYAKAHLFQIEGAAWDAGLLDHTDRIQRLHREQGIPEHILTPLWRIVDTYLTGFIDNEIAELEHAPEPPVDGAPDWLQTAEAAYTDASFEQGIGIIAAGIRALAAPDPCEWRTPNADKDLKVSVK